MHKKILLAVGVLSLGFLLLNWTNAKQNQSQPHSWAAVSINGPLFHEGWTKDLSPHFTVVNDGSETVDPVLDVGVTQPVLREAQVISGLGRAPSTSL